MELGNLMMLLCGLGLFLFGMKLMGDGLEMATGSRLKMMVEKLTTNKYMGALVGLAVTAVIQSSSATTVMVVGFVNAGIMSLAQAVGVIMGANVGTTITGFMIALKLNSLAPIAIFLGVTVMMFSKKVHRKHIGQIITGFGILFFGMTVMSDAMKPLGESPVFGNIISQFQNPLVGVLVGLVFTAIIQSSSASVGVLQALASQNIIGLNSAVFVIYGQNIGTCVTALLSCIGTSKTAKRTAVVHLLFNIIGALLFIAITLLLPFTQIVERLLPGNTMMQISLVHICFNVVSTAILLPLSNYLVALACKVVPGEDKKREAVSFQFLDSRILNTPPIAVAQVLKEVDRMSDLAKKSFNDAMDMLFQKDDSLMERLEENENVLDFLNTGVTEYLVKINALDIEDKDREVLGSLFHVVSDLERIGDHSINIGEIAQTFDSGRAALSQEATEELQDLRKLVFSVLTDAYTLFNKRGDDAELAERINRTEEEIDDRTELLKDRHIARLNQGKCSPRAGALYNDMLTNLERIADHAINIAFAIKGDDAGKKKAAVSAV